MLKGFFFILGNIIIASIQSVFLSHWLKDINVFLVIALSFTTVMLLYLSIFILKGKHFTVVVKTMGKEVLFLNLVSAGNWIFYFLAIRYLNPASVVTITQCMPPVLISIYMLLSGKQVLRTTLFFHSMIFLCLILLFRDIFLLPVNQDKSPIIGTIISVLCAVTVAMTINVSKSFSNKGLPSFVVLSLRFPLLIILSWSMTPKGAVGKLDFPQICIIFSIALVGLALANYCLQKGIELSNPVVVSTTLSISPFIVLLFDKITREDFTVNLQVMLILSIVLLSLCCVYYNYKLSRTRK